MRNVQRSEEIATGSLLYILFSDLSDDDHLGNLSLKLKREFKRN